MNSPNKDKILNSGSGKWAWICGIDERIAKIKGVLLED